MSRDNIPEKRKKDARKQNINNENLRNQVQKYQYLRLMAEQKKRKTYDLWRNKKTKTYDLWRN